eukprot:INCI16793.1.p1 GENE.INCI16793.1~~INCI16793.1.p1  ORF type:complete len:312 (-),score=45.16 INCI16793.1:92-1027(-)
MRAASKLLRRTLHAHPGVSNSEHETATRIIQFLKDYEGVSLLHQKVGDGAGLVFEVRGHAQQGGALQDENNSSSLAPGSIPTVLLRSDMDALPLVEASGLPHASTVPGVHHACGHDGHSAMLAAALARLSEDRESWSGRVLGVFQPAEETGDGALQMITALPDVVGAPGINRGAFGIHNIPGAPLGHVLVRPEGTAARASTGLAITVEGVASHASEPRNGQSPAVMLGRVVQHLGNLPAELEAAGRLPPQISEPALATPVHLRVGNEGDFGILPANGQLSVTLRADSDESVHWICFSLRLFCVLCLASCTR